MDKFSDFIRRMFVQHIIKLINDDPNGYGYQLIDLKEGDEATVLEFHSNRPVENLYDPGDGRPTLVFGTRGLTITIKGHYERRDPR